MNALQTYDITNQLNQGTVRSRGRTTQSQRSPSVSGFWFEQGLGGDDQNRTVIGIWFNSTSVVDECVTGSSLFGEPEKDDSEAVERSIHELYARYIIANRDSLIAFLKGHRALPSLLIDIASNLRLNFGKDPLFKLEVVSVGDEPPIIRISILWTATVESGNAALEAFDNQYWLAASHRAAGNVVIDCELV